MKYLTHAKILDQRNPRKKFEPRNPLKNQDPREMSTHATHVTHVKTWPTQSTHPRNPRTHVTYATIQPTQFSRNVIVHADNIWCYMVWWEFEKWRAIHPSLGGVGGVLVRACVDGVGGMLVWVASYCYCYCCCWNTIMKKRMLNVYFWKKNEKMFQKD